MAAVATPEALGEYLASVTTQPQFTAAQKAFESAVPDDAYSRYKAFGESPFGLWPVSGEAPSWMGAMPASDVSFLSSFLAREYSIMTGGAKGSAPTNRPRVEVVGAALTVGAAGLAML